MVNGNSNQIKRYQKAVKGYKQTNAELRHARSRTTTSSVKKTYTQQINYNERMIGDNQHAIKSLRKLKRRK